jgi:hypothetical protein
VHRGDRRLQLVRPDLAARQRRRDDRHALRDRRAIPQRSILRVERNELTREPRSRGAAPGPGAADASAAIAYARSGVSTSTIQYPARNSFVSGNTPSVIGLPSAPARTSFA